MTILGLALAAAALVVAIVALVVSGAQLRIQRAEHKAFLDQINAHASLFAEMHFMEHDADVQQVDQGTVYRVLAIGMRNVGQRAAEQVSVNVLAPVEIEMTWCGPKGEPRSDQLTAPTAEKLSFDGRELACHYLDRPIGPVPLSAGGVMAYVFLRIPVGAVEALDPSTVEPPHKGIPIRVKLSSDDFPKDARTVVLDRTWEFIGPVRRA